MPAVNSIDFQIRLETIKKRRNRTQSERNRTQSVSKKKHTSSKKTLEL